MRSPIASLLGLFFFGMANASASQVVFSLEKCSKTGTKPAVIHDCTPITEKNLYLTLNKIAAKPVLTGSEKKRMFRHEEKLGEHEISIGAWKPDFSKALTVINVSLLEEGRGQVDYNEVSFYDDKIDNYISLSLRPNMQGEYYRIKLTQKPEKAIAFDSDE